MSTLIRTSDNAKTSLDFETLRLAVGEDVRIETNTPRLRLKASYAGAHANKLLMLSLGPKSLQLKKLPAGVPVTLRFIVANRACAISTRLLKAPSAALPLLFLEYPKSVDVVQIRKTVRARAKVIVSLDKDESLNSKAGWPRQALCTDISLHGARLEASDLLGDVGASLLMTARMPVGDVDQLLMVNAVIRNVEDYEDPISGDFRVIHGVEFTELSEETSLVLSGFVYQQMLKDLGAI